VRIVDRLDAGDRAQVGVGCCRAPEDDASTERMAGVEPRPTRRRFPTAQVVWPSYDCVLCVAQHADGGVVGAHDHRPGRAPGAGLGHAGAGPTRARTAATAKGSGRSRRPCDPAGGTIGALRRPRRHGRSADPVSGSASETPLLFSGGSGHPGRVTRDFRCGRATVVSAVAAVTPALSGGRERQAAAGPGAWSSSHPEARTPNDRAPAAVRPAAVSARCDCAQLHAAAPSISRRGYGTAGSADDAESRECAEG
jgi:hypothetical protein